MEKSVDLGESPVRLKGMQRLNILQVAMVCVVFTGFYTTASQASVHHYSKRSGCVSSDFKSCPSCQKLAKATATGSPDAGDYEDDTQWNGLFTAFRLNCFSVGQDLLQRGANPNWGGKHGSMILSVSSKWPHKNRNVNKKWAELLLKYGASIHSKVPNADIGVAAQAEETPPAYPDIYALFKK